MKNSLNRSYCKENKEIRLQILRFVETFLNCILAMALINISEKQYKLSTKVNLSLIHI